jgi:hypothetical protein
MARRTMSGNALSGFGRFGYLALQLGATRSETRADQVNVNFQGKKQIRVSHWNPENMYRPFYALKIGFERREFRDAIVEDNQ